MTLSIYDDTQNKLQTALQNSASSIIKLSVFLLVVIYSELNLC